MDGVTTLGVVTVGELQRVITSGDTVLAVGLGSVAVRELAAGLGTALRVVAVRELQRVIAPGDAVAVAALGVIAVSERRGVRTSGTVLSLSFYSLLR